MHHAEQSSASSGNLSLPANSDLIYNSVLSSQYHSTSAQAPGLNNLPSFNKISWRKGKWIDEEGVYTKKLIEAFNAGLLKIPSGTTLRSFLAEQLSWYGTYTSSIDQSLKFITLNNSLYNFTVTL